MDTIDIHLSFIMCSLSASLLEHSLKKVHRVLESGFRREIGTVIIILCASLSKADPFKTFTYLYPLLTAKIRFELNENLRGSVRSLQSCTRAQDHNLYLYLRLLSQVLCKSGRKELLAIAEYFFSLISQLRRRCLIIKISEQAELCWSTFLKSLIDTYPQDNRLHTSLITLETWGVFGNPQDLQIFWHVPTNEEIQMAIKFFFSATRVLCEEISELKSSL
jgi:proteasome activator subunit 4